MNAPNQVGSLWFMIAAFLNAFSMTAMLITLGAAGYRELAGSISLVQGATLATFYVFSANGRNLILSNVHGTGLTGLLPLRLLLLMPLAWVSYVLSVNIGHVTPFQALILLLRRVGEWIGELGLAEEERLGLRGRAMLSALVEAATFVTCVVLTIVVKLPFELAAIAWACAPILSASKILRSGVAQKMVGFKILLPHLGSTAIVGVSTFVFRAILVMLVGNAAAGDLLTAFAIGGVIPNVFNRVLGPSMVRQGGYSLPQSRGTMLLVGAMIMVGGVTALMAPAQSLWLPTGISLMGGAVMVIAVLLRSRLIHGADEGAFGPDLLANILIIFLVPSIYFIFGDQPLGALYLISAVLNFIYMSGAIARSHSSRVWLDWILLLTGLLLLSPLLLTVLEPMTSELSGNCCRIDHTSVLASTIVALTLFACIALLGNFADSSRSLWLIFFSMLTCMVSLSVQEIYDVRLGSSAFVMIGQLVMPVFGMLLGEMYGKTERTWTFELTAACVLMLILPINLAVVWQMGRASTMAVVGPTAEGYSFQQMSLIVALTTLVSLAFARKGGHAGKLVVMVISVAIATKIAGISGSLVAGVYVGAVLLMALIAMQKRQQLFARMVLALVLLLQLAQFYIEVRPPTSGASVVESSSAEEGHISMKADELKWESGVLGGRARLPADDTDRVHDAWVAVRTFMFGNLAVQSGNADDASPHSSNYWISGIHNFGIISILPLTVFFIHLGRLLARQRRSALLSPDVFGVLMASGFLLLAESTGIQRPGQIYAWIVAYFLIGLLMVRLSSRERELTPAKTLK